MARRSVARCRQHRIRPTTGSKATTTSWTYRPDGTLKDALAQLRMAFVQVSRQDEADEAPEEG